MGIWTLYNPKLPIWPLIGLPDLAGDRPVAIVIVIVIFHCALWPLAIFIFHWPCFTKKNPIPITAISMLHPIFDVDMHILFYAKSGGLTLDGPGQMDRARRTLLPVRMVHTWHSASLPLCGVYVFWWFMHA
jgi:hypothetical protein